MKKWNIDAPESANYLSDFMTEIPANCLFNKKLTGCGATELAIRNEVPTIIAMPYVALVKNKTIYRTDNIEVLGVYEGVTDSDIIEFARTHSPLKIAVTYDSLPRTIRALQSDGINPYRDMFLLVDEWHVLFNAYSFRHRAIKELLSEAAQFARATYMTATPIEREYVLDELKHLPICEINWPKVAEINVRSRQTNKPDKYIADECAKVLRDGLPHNLHIFVNSVKFIGQIIEHLDLTPDNTKVVCSTSGDAKVENEKKLKGFPISEPSDPARKINFYTSTCFEGCDIMDENGVTFIVSDGRQAHTMLEISTLFTQICGRIRNSAYKGEIVHVYSTTKYSEDVTLEEYTEATNKILAEARDYAKEINAISEKNRIKTLAKIPYINEQYVRIEDNRLVVDKNLANIDIVNFKITRHIYRTFVNLAGELQKNGYRITRYSFSPIMEKLMNNPEARVSFRELFDEYAELKTRQSVEPILTFENYREQYATIENKHPLVKPAYERLGEERVQALKYHVGNIRRELIKGKTATNDYKIVKMLNFALPKQTPIPKSTVKAEIQRIYTDFGLAETPKASDLSKWYITKETSPKINGKTVACITIIRDKLIVK